MKDRSTVSNDFYEIRKVAKKMGVPASFVMLAKEQTKSNSRSKIEFWIQDHRIIIKQKEL